MAKGIHKGSEFNNVNETWNQNERNKPVGSSADEEASGLTTNDNLKQVIKEEAEEYDRANKEERILGGDRATVNDDDQRGSGTAEDA